MIIVWLVTYIGVTPLGSCSMTQVKKYSRVSGGCWWPGTREGIRKQLSQLVTACVDNNQLEAASNFDDLVKLGDRRQIRRSQMFIKLVIWIRMWRHFNVSSNHTVARQWIATNINFCPEVFIFHKPNWCSLIDNYFRHKTPCRIRKLTAAFVSKIGVFSRFSWSLDFGTKLAEFSLPVLQIWQSQNRVSIEIQLINIHVSECKYYCLMFIFGPQIWRYVPLPKLASAPDW